MDANSKITCRSKVPTVNNLRMKPKRLEKYADSRIVALVELDMQKMRVSFILARDAVKERLRELKHPRDNPQNPPSSAQ